MAKVKFPEAEARLYHRVFICMACGARMRADPEKVKAKKVKCRKCKRKKLRPIHREHKA
jgi:ribosomal protein L40E